jgi:SEC-C motif-containing protein
MKMSSNSSCPCKSGKKYKKCCKPYHDGSIPENASLLMRSRFSAYAIGLTDYIVKTTYKTHESFLDSEWKSQIEFFTNNTKFLGLKILEVKNGESESFVKFKASLLTVSNNDISFTENSRFLKENNTWFYESGEMSTK